MSLTFHTDALIHVDIDATMEWPRKLDPWSATSNDVLETSIGGNADAFQI